MTLRRKRWTALFLLIGWMATIYLFSSQNVDQSAQTSQPFAAFLARLMGEPLSSLSGAELQRVLDTYQHIVRKTAHVCEYLILAALLYILWSLYPIRLGFRLPMTLLPGVLYGALDEAHQMRVAGRGPGVGDVLFDSLGVILGIGLCLTVELLRRRRANAKKGS